MSNQAQHAGLALEPHLEDSINKNPTATLHNSRRSFYRAKTKYYRPIDHNKGNILIHQSVKDRWDQQPKYSPKNQVEYIASHGWPDILAE
jgi:hypothetical protein